MDTEAGVTHSVMDGDDAGQNTDRKTIPDALAARRWKTGVSANPGGRPRVPDDVRALARSCTIACLNRLAALAGVSPGKDKLVRTTATPSVQLAATVALLDRAWGRPEQAVHVTGEALAPGLAADDAAMLVIAIRAEIARRARLDAAIEAESTPIATSQTPEKP